MIIKFYMILDTWDHRLKMAQGKGRGKVSYADIKKDDNHVAGSRTNSSSTTMSGTPEQAMDEHLKKINMFRKPVAKDGSCLFRVVSEQVYMI